MNDVVTVSLLAVVVVAVLFLVYCFLQFSLALQHPDPLTKLLLRVRKPRLRVMSVEGTLTRQRLTVVQTVAEPPTENPSQFTRLAKLEITEPSR